jgi:phosphatidylglycerol:prolipoprotein diacylglycerol transferase
VLFYDPTLIWSFRADFPWWGVLRLSEGGMASHGGMLGVILATWFVARGPRDRATGARPQRVSWLHVLDLAAVACTPGLFFGRVANFVNGELLGRIVAMPGQPAPWWSVKFPQEVYSGHEPTPDQPALVERALAPLARAGESGGETFDRVLGAIQSGRAPEAARTLEPLLSARHPSQLYQAAAEGLVLGAVLWLLWRRPRRAGVIGAMFMAVYGVLRIVTEFWRLPDADLAVQRVLGLSRGQWLSVAMVLVGAGALAVFRWRDRRSPGPVFAGWGR